MIGRIALPRTTTVSLNDRFSTLRQLREQQEEARQQQQQQASSAASRQLVDLMETRPAVRAALGTHQTVTPLMSAPPVPPPAPPPAQKRLHVKQRLAIQARLGVLRTAPVSGGALSSRLGRGATNIKRLQTARSPAAVSQPQRGRGRAGGATFTSPRPRGGAAAAARGRGRGRGGTGALRGRGRGRGAARGRAATSAPVSKEELDKELDSYMSGTRGHLDAELDAYMKEAET